MRHEPGTRVGAISHEDEEGRVHFFGYGTYAGDEVPATAGGWMGDLLREMGRPNPKIVLDSGDVVWGCECWWGPEEAVRARLDGREVVEASIAEARERAAQRG